MFIAFCLAADICSKDDGDFGRFLDLLMRERNKFFLFLIFYFDFFLIFQNEVSDDVLPADIVII